MNTLEIVGQIAALKETDYKTNLLLASLVELLIERDVLTKSDLQKKTRTLDFISELEIRLQNQSRVKEGC